MSSHKRHPLRHSRQLDRRDWLGLAAGTLATSLLPRSVLAAPARSGQPDSRFLLVFLRGGYDALSLLVPAQSSFYREVRPAIGLAVSADAGAGNAAMVASSVATSLASGANKDKPSDASARLLDPNWALHPAVEASLRPLWARRQLAFVPFAGTDDTSRSHFETQDSIELGQPLGAGRDFNSGFLNRLAGQLAGREAMAFTEQLPTIFKGRVDVANGGLAGQPGKSLSPSLQSAVAGMYAHHALGEKVNEGFEVRQQLMQDYAAEMDAASRRAVNARGFEAQARRMARLMRERYALGFIDVGGWDTHVNQGAANGYLATQLADLARGLSAYADEMGEAAWARTTVVVLSEFGRTLRENGNRGTDHGHGSVHWVLGGGLQGGRIVGEQQAIEARTLFQNRDLPVLNDYRAVLGGLLQRQFGLSVAALDQVFPGARPRDLGLI
jgi:uncharacterized protein (DUF1501 family)